MELIPLFFSQQNGMTPDSVENQGRVETGFKELLLTILGKHSFPQSTLSSKDSGQPVKGIQESHLQNSKNHSTVQPDTGLRTDQGVTPNNKDISGHLEQEQTSLADSLAITAGNGKRDHQHAQGIALAQIQQSNNSERILRDNAASLTPQELLSVNVTRITEQSEQAQPAIGGVERSMDGDEIAGAVPVDTTQEIPSHPGNSTAMSPPFSYNSSAYTYSLLSIQSLIATNDKTILAYHSRFMAQISSPSAEHVPYSNNNQGNDNLQQSPAKMDLLTTMKAGGIEPARYESSSLSISIDTSLKPLRSLHNQFFAHQSTILDQIQRLINQNQDSVQIKVSTEQAIQPGRQSEFPMATDNLLRAPQTNAALPVTDPSGSSKQIVNSAQPSLVTPLSETHRDVPQESLRESIAPIKTAATENNNEKQKDQSFQSDKESPQRNFTHAQSGTHTAASNSSPVSAEQVGTETGFVSQFRESSQGVQAQSGTNSSVQQHSFPLHEHEIINQIVERFTLYNRPQTSRLSMQLHPAELGKLKIEIVVKGDTLKANIYAQTSQAGEIIDRNLPRLRALLHSHGISVEELVVSFKSDDIDQFNTQQDQLFHEQPHLAKQEHSHAGSSFETFIEDTLATDTEEQSGVNLTI